MLTQNLNTAIRKRLDTFQRQCCQKIICPRLYAFNALTTNTECGSSTGSEWQVQTRDSQMSHGSTTLSYLVKFSKLVMTKVMVKYFHLPQFLKFFFPFHLNDLPFHFSLQLYHLELKKFLQTKHTNISCNIVINFHSRGTFYSKTFAFKSIHA